MNLPESLTNAQTFTVVGPMGTKVSDSLLGHPVIAVDGGAKNTSRIDIWIGDNDSIKNSVQATYKINLNPVKDTSDLAETLSLLEQTKVTQIHLWGFLGGRKDHELFNLGECLAFLTKKTTCSIFIYQDDGKISFKLFPAGENIFEHNGPFSLGTLLENEISMTGSCQYLIQPARKMKPLSSLGLSNQGCGKIKLTSSQPLFVIFPGDI